MDKPPTYNEALAAVVEQAIADGGQSQNGIAEATGIPRTTLIRRLRGHQSFTAEELHGIANVLGITVRSLVDAADTRLAEAAVSA